MNKTTKQYRVLFILFGLLGCFFLVRTALHPRPHNICFLVVQLLFCLLNYILMKNGGRLKKEPVIVQQEEEDEEDKKQRLSGLRTMFVCYLMAMYVAYMVGMITDLSYPHHTVWEYKRDIAKLKEDDSASYYFFPDRIPEQAEDVNWIMRPGFLQGGFADILFFKAPTEYIESEIAKYSKDAIETEDEEDFPFCAYYDRERRDFLTVYKLYDNEDWNHSHKWGIFVDKERNRIGYFRE